MSIPNKPYTPFFFCLAILAIASCARADQKAELSPVLTTGSAGAASDDFSNAELSKSWATAKGTWTVKDGKLSGVELAADKHAAVLTYKLPHTDSAVRLSFQLAGSKGFHLSFNHPKGHLFRVMVTEKGALVRTDKDKKNPASKSVIINKQAGKFEQGKWYSILCETKGDKVAVQFSNGVKLEGAHQSLTKKKTGYRLVLRGDGVLFDDFSVLNAE